MKVDGAPGLASRLRDVGSMIWHGTIRPHKWCWLLGALFACDGTVAYHWVSHNREKSQDRRILYAARRYDVDPALVKAIVWRESRFNPAAHGKAGEVGLMQIGKAAASEWAAAEELRYFNHLHLLDPQQNILAGAWYIGKLLKRYSGTDNPLPYALADYNAGRSNVLRWNNGRAATNSALFIGEIGFPMTQDYVVSVMERRQIYEKSFR